MSMNLKSLSAFAVALAVLAVPTVGAQPKPDQELSIAASASKLTVGQELKVTGNLTGGTAQDISGQKITLRRDPFPYDGAYQRVDDVQTNDAGEYSFTLKPDMNARYRTSAKGGVESPEVTVLVRVAVTLLVSDKTPDRGDKVTFSGGVAPAHDSKVAKIQRRTRKGWKRIAKTVLQDAGKDASSYSKDVTIRKSGRYRVRVKPRDGDHKAGKSKAIRLKVQ